MRRHSFLYCLIASLWLYGAPAAGHHNTGAAFDLEKETEIIGEVTRYEYKNPHIYFYVTANDGTEWRVEAGPLALMNRFGWSKTTLKAGDRISMVGNPSRRPGRPSAYLKSASVDGVPLPASRGELAFEKLTADSADPVEIAQNLGGTWVTVLDLENSRWVDYPEELPLSEKGREAVENYDEKTMSPALECIPMTAPASMLIPDTKRIEIRDQMVLITSEFNGASRQISLSAPAIDEPTIQGNSTGTLRKNSLHVETTGFAPHTMGIASGLASGESKRLIESFDLSDDGKFLTYRFTLEDSEYLAEPLTGEARWIYRPSTKFEALPCDLDNSRLFLDE